MFFFLTYALEPVALLLYFWAAWVYRKNTKLPSAKWLAVYYLISTLLQAYSILQSKLFGNGNNWLYDAAGVLTAVFIGRYFHRLLIAPQKKKTVVALVILYLVYALTRQVTMEGQRLFDSLGYAILSASVTVYVFMYFHQVLKNVAETNILHEFNFWLASSYLLYYVGCFVIFVSYFFLTAKLLQNFTVEGRNLLMALWGLHNVLLFVAAISLLIGSLCVVYRRRSL